jgi:uncharacterized protein (DUF2249 family)
MENTGNTGNTPTWLNKENIVISLDVREMLASGQHPVEKVLSETATLTSGQIYELVTPFTPFPLIEKVRNQGFESYTVTISSNEVHTYFCKK